jgi:hypothetical protein
MDGQAWPRLANLVSASARVMQHTRRKTNECVESLMQCVLESGPLVPERLCPNVLVTPRFRVKLHHELAVVDGGLALQGGERVRVRACVRACVIRGQCVSAFGPAGGTKRSSCTQSTCTLDGLSLRLPPLAQEGIIRLTDAVQDHMGIATR